VNSKYPKDSTS